MRKWKTTTRRGLEVGLPLLAIGSLMLAGSFAIEDGLSAQWTRLGGWLLLALAAVVLAVTLLLGMRQRWKPNPFAKYACTSCGIETEPDDLAEGGAYACPKCGMLVYPPATQ